MELRIGRSEVVDGVTAKLFEHVLDTKEKEYSFRCLVIVSDLLEGGRLVKLGLGGWWMR